jgi:hypothetical protein
MSFSCFYQKLLSLSPTFSLSDPLIFLFFLIQCCILLFFAINSSPNKLNNIELVSDLGNLRTNLSFFLWRLFLFNSLISSSSEELWQLSSLVGLWLVDRTWRKCSGGGRFFILRIISSNCWIAWNRIKKLNDDVCLFFFFLKKMFWPGFTEIQVTWFFNQVKLSQYLPSFFL